MIAKAESVALVGMDGYAVEVEVSVAPGLPAFTIVGLPDAAIQEARERVRSAIHASHEEWPLRRVTVNLSPAHLRKAGSSFDLAMALAVLAAAGRVPPERLRGVCVLGELSLDGTVHTVRGVLPAALAAGRNGTRRMMLPAGNTAEAALVEGLEVLPVTSLSLAARALRGEIALDPPPEPVPGAAVDGDLPDLGEVRGQRTAKRALEIAAAGGHNLLMRGPPGGGKTMLARRLPAVLPPPSADEAFELTRIYSVAGLLPEDQPLMRRRPFRAPHHSVSVAGLVGGGSGIPQPGEVSLAHRGVLFLDECGEFRRDAMQALRGPLEDGHVTIVRAAWAVTYPSRFQLVAATNPCPCGFKGDRVRPCECPPGRIAAYKERLSGPILDRIDLQVNVERVSRAELFGSGNGDPAEVVRERVAAARAEQGARLAPLGMTCNAEIPPRALEEVCRLSPAAHSELGDAVDRMALSARAAHRTMRVARTIADLDGSPDVTREHVNDALTYRLLDVPD